MAFPIDIMSRGFSHVRLCPRPCSRRAPACIDGGPPGRDAVETACGLVDQLRVLQIVNVGAFDYQKSDMLRYLDIPVVDRSAPDEIFLPPASTFLSPSTTFLPPSCTFLHLLAPSTTFPGPYKVMRRFCAACLGTLCGTWHVMLNARRIAMYLLVGAHHNVVRAPAVKSQTLRTTLPKPQSSSTLQGQPVARSSCIVVPAGQSCCAMPCIGRVVRTYFGVHFDICFSDRGQPRLCVPT